MSNLVVSPIVSAPPVLHQTIENYVVDCIWAAHDAGKSVVSLNALLDHLCHVPQSYDETGAFVMSHFYLARSEDAPAICVVHGKCPDVSILPDVVDRIKAMIDDVAEDGLFWYCCTQCGSKNLEMQESGGYSFDPFSGPTDSITWTAVCEACDHEMTLA